MVVATDTDGDDDEDDDSDELVDDAAEGSEAAR
jgi:hypothetical protein